MVDWQKYDLRIDRKSLAGQGSDSLAGQGCDVKKDENIFQPKQLGVILYRESDG